MKVDARPVTGGVNISHCACPCHKIMIHDDACALCRGPGYSDLCPPPDDWNVEYEHLDA